MDESNEVRKQVMALSGQVKELIALMRDAAALSMKDSLHLAQLAHRVRDLEVAGGPQSHFTAAPTPMPAPTFDAVRRQVEAGQGSVPSFAGAVRAVFFDVKDQPDGSKMVCTNGTLEQAASVLNNPHSEWAPNCSRDGRPCPANATSRHFDFIRLLKVA